MMDKQSLSETFSKVKKYTKDLKQQASINNSQQWIDNYSSNEQMQYDIPYSQPGSLAFQKSKLKMQSAVLIKGQSPVHSRGSNYSRQKSSLNMSMKMPMSKKDIQSDYQKQSAFNKSQGKIQIKHLSNLFNSTLGIKQNYTKKNGHSHTYTYLNDLESDKNSEIDSNFSVKQKINRVRHSKSPSKQRHIEHNNTSYAEQSYKVGHLNRIHIRQKQFDEHKPIKTPTMQSKYLLEQILHLEQTIKQYKMVIITMKHKYLQMEDKLKEKALNDHYVDVLKQKIQEMQDKNYALNVVIQEQQKIINQREQKFIGKLNQINSYFTQCQQKNVRVEKENQFLREILLIANDKTDKMDKCSDNTKVQTSKQAGKDPYFQTVSKSYDQFCTKWT